MKEKITRFILLLVLGTTVFTPAYAVKIKRKGRFLHTEIVGFDDKTSFRITLNMQDASSFPVLKVTKLTLRTIREIKVFETVIDEFNTSHSTQNIKDYGELTVIPNEYIKANPSTRMDTIVEGPFANTTFLVDGTPMTTDKQGLIVDKQQRLLRRFDDLNFNQVEIEVTHPTFGSIKTPVTRLIIRPEEQIIPDYKKHDPKATLDLLEALGIDSTIPSKPEANPLLIDCSYPQNVMPGDVFPMTVKVTNRGKAVTGNLVLCTFARETWLDGFLFYFGNLPAGRTKTFVRFIKAPDGFLTKKSFALLSSWDTVRPQPTNARLIVIRH